MSPDDGGSAFVQNVSGYLPDYAALRLHIQEKSTHKILFDMFSE
jgi:hypothetical protein